MIDLRRFSVNSERFAGWYVFRWQARRAFNRLPLLPGESAVLTHWRRDGFLDFIDHRYCPGDIDKLRSALQAFGELGD